MALMERYFNATNHKDAPSTSRELRRPAIAFVGLGNLHVFKTDPESTRKNDPRVSTKEEVGMYRLGVVKGEECWVGGAPHTAQEEGVPGM
ncbi:hypothetical protein CEP54_015581 [Fusarium duplospermum]|uniref:Uncharacterized protein n=1 Tax=Fusarium duplospermum TaxID=1325734 RepID=A0A428NMY8_9HYPO|nr:hypothetical protein CEP54_015581 [Fusarium duplospermum]